MTFNSKNFEVVHTEIICVTDKSVLKASVSFLNWLSKELYEILNWHNWDFIWFFQGYILSSWNMAGMKYVFNKYLQSSWMDEWVIKYTVFI